MASDDKHSDQQKKSKKQRDKKSTDNKETMENFMSRICSRFERLHLLSRLLEEPEEQTQRNPTELRRKSKKSQKISKNVHAYFCDQPSTSEQSDPKSPSKKKQLKLKSSSSSNMESNEETEMLSAEEFDNADLSEQIEDNTIIDLPQSTHSPIFDEQPYIENPEEPSTSTGFRTVRFDDEILAKVLGPPNFVVEETEQSEKGIMHKPKVSTLYAVQKETQQKKHSDNESLSASSKQAVIMKQTKDEKTSSAISASDKVDLKNIKAEDIRGRIIFKINEYPTNKPIMSEMKSKSESERAEQARKRLRRKFEEGQKYSSQDKPKSGGGNK
ncbi:unnamed protein product [Wuchereria bancrofti]|uniref:Uncharacterized protein n=1 Tax=Wuchereria bancrofti TaxID=6293 RepID=A0A3P7EQC4_WUCBA|nr:unnamed protein product [Wuchereria bancrofti]